MRVLFPHTCRVIAYRDTIDPVSGVTKQTPHTLIESLPCMVSFRRSPEGEREDGAVVFRQGIRLYAPPQTELPPGCAVEFGGRVYRHSGMDASYPSHTEFDLILEGKA
ncbi:MAG: hypothetical protein IJC88_04910 [Oscillospiraceae bacterium]|nr:hypothetical protein [Oscillospiraceae bacterium]